MQPQAPEPSKAAEGLAKADSRPSSKVRKTEHDRLPIIGWREWVTLSSLNVQPIKAKIDTGARTSAIHAYRIRPFDRDGDAWIEFFLHPTQGRKQPEVRCEAPVLEQRKVKSSTGHSELRYVIETQITLAGKALDIELTLTNRDQMGFRMLIGREAVRERFLVDPGRSFRGGQPRADEITLSPKGTDS